MGKNKRKYTTKNIRKITTKRTINNEHLDNLDLLKTFGIMAVIALHTGLLNCEFTGKGNFFSVIQYALRLITEGVPMFLAINGLLLLRKEAIDLEKHIRKTLKLFVLFLVWAVILTFAGCILTVPGETVSLRVIIKYIVKARIGEQYTGVLWYLQGLIAVYLVYPVIWYAYRNRFELFKYLFVVMSIFVPGARCIELVLDAISPFYNVDKATELIGFISRFNGIGNGWYIFYFCLGGMVWHYRDMLLEKKRLAKWVCLLSWGAAFIYGYLLSLAYGSSYKSNFNYASPFMVFFVIALLIATSGYKNTGKTIHKLIESVGKNTLGMYLSHFVFIYAVNRIYLPVDFIGRVIVWITVVIMAYLFSFVASMTPGLDKIVKM